MHDSINKECPKCGSTEFGREKQSGYVKMSSGRFNLGSNIKFTPFIQAVASL